MQPNQENKSSWLDHPVITNLTINWETLIFILILIIAFFSRFYDLESRVMSHDENSHVYYSWRLSEGMGYQHTPLTHGPLLFHLTAVSYFMFGDNDFTARIPFVLFNIATIGFLWFYRQYLGRVGTLIAAGTESGRIRLFDRAGNLRWGFETGGSLKSLALSGSGTTLAVGSGNTLTVFDTAQVPRTPETPTPPPITTSPTPPPTTEAGFEAVIPGIVAVTVLVMLRKIGKD